MNICQLGFSKCDFALSQSLSNSHLQSPTRVFNGDMCCFSDDCGPSPGSSTDQVDNVGEGT